jgi:hypothetical protein
MKDELFDELLESVRQGGAIQRGGGRAGRRTKIDLNGARRTGILGSSAGDGNPARYLPLGSLKGLRFQRRDKVVARKRTRGHGWVLQTRVDARRDGAAPADVCRATKEDWNG